MLKIKKVIMKNFCGYKDATFDFTGNDGNPNDISLLFGPNGTGKSTLLNAIQILSSPKEHIGRDLSVTFRKLIYNQDYDPSYQELKVAEGLVEVDDMYLEGIFETDDGEKRIIFEASGDGSKRSGIVLNELPLNPRERNNNRNAYFIDADNPMNMNKFIMPKDKYVSKFLDIAETVYGFKCYLALPATDEHDGETHVFYDDFVIEKPRGQDLVKVHFKRMSAGEKKIATLLRHLCNPEYIDNLDIIIIDNLEMHVYFKRHKSMIDKLLEHFPNKQFICSSHSETMIDHIREIRGKRSLYDIEDYHGNLGQGYKRIESWNKIGETPKMEPEIVSAKNEPVAILQESEIKEEPKSKPKKAGSEWFNVFKPS
jgi:AAA15 family ATPase/GTPase